MANVSVFDNGTAKYGVAIEGIVALAEISDMPAKIEQAARRAVNSTLDWTRTRAAEAIRTNVAFPASYLNPSEGRLAVKQYAAGPQLEGKIGARFDATSLARFVVGNPKAGNRNGAGVQVMVKPGSIKTIAGGFMIPLRNGNTGLAVRSNGPPPRAYKPKSLGNGLWLLYGPSIAQVFGEIRQDIGPAAAGRLEAEFDRQMELK